MKVLSFDVGTRNLAYCLVEFMMKSDDHKIECRIDAWDVLDLGGSTNTPEKCSLVLTRVLNDTFIDIPSLKIDCVLVERQPKRSVSMLAVQMFLCQYFSSYVHDGHIKHVHFVSPKLKLDHTCLGSVCPTGLSLTSLVNDIDNDDNNNQNQHDAKVSKSKSKSNTKSKSRAKYTKNKKDAIAITRHLLEHVLIDHAKLVEFDAAHKCDDLADAFLQALCWTTTCVGAFTKKQLSSHQTNQVHDGQNQRDVCGEVAPESA